MGLIKLEPAVLRRAAKDLNQSISQLGSVNNLIQSVAPRSNTTGKASILRSIWNVLRRCGKTRGKSEWNWRTFREASAALQLVQSRPTGKRSRRSTESNKL